MQYYINLVYTQKKSQYFFIGLEQEYNIVEESSGLEFLFELQICWLYVTFSSSLHSTWLMTWVAEKKIKVWSFL